MQHPQPALSAQIETISELRELYRAAEARASRLRLLSATGRDLAAATDANLEVTLQSCGNRLAYFVGQTQALLSFAADASGLPITQPGNSDQILARIDIEGLSAPDDVPDSEDREAVRMILELMGATIDRIDRDRERDRLLTALREREQRLEFLVGRIFSAQEEERRRVSHELHDGVAQTATALVRMLEGAGPNDGASLPAGNRIALAGIARDLVNELRAVIGGLRPTMLDDLGLEACLRTLADQLQSDGFSADVKVDHHIVQWPQHVETALFRVAQEAVSNIRKHAGGPCRVHIALSAGANAEDRYLRISDHGKPLMNEPDVGEDDPYRGRHVGIDVMRERMMAIGGRLDWQRHANGGVTVTAWLPEII